jgi:hypothetical protein
MVAASAVCAFAVPEEIRMITLPKSAKAFEDFMTKIWSGDQKGPWSEDANDFAIECKARATGKLHNLGWSDGSVWEIWEFPDGSKIAISPEGGSVMCLSPEKRAIWMKGAK